MTEIPEHLRAAAERLQARRIADEEQAHRLEAERASSWEPVSVLAGFDGVKRPMPTILARADGKHLIYPGRVHWIQGEPESMKSWLAQFAAVQVLHDGGSVLYVDYEDDEDGVGERLRLLGAKREDVDKRFVYVKPESPVGSTDRPTISAAKLGELLEHGYTLAVLDGVTESLAIEGCDPNDNAAVADWLHRLPRRISRNGVAVAVIDHVTKATEGRGRYAIGAQHKLAGLDGVALVVEMISPLGRAEYAEADVESITGRARIVVAKDRSGAVRGICTETKHAGTFEVTSWPDGKITAELAVEVHAAEPPMEIYGELMRVLERFGGTDSETHLVKHADLVESEAIESLRWLLDKGWIETERKGNSTTYKITTKGNMEWNTE